MPEADGKRSAAIDREIEVLRRYIALRRADPALPPLYNDSCPAGCYWVDGRMLTLRQLANRVEALERAMARAQRMRAWRAASGPRKAVA